MFLKELEYELNSMDVRVECCNLSIKRFCGFQRNPIPYSFATKGRIGMELKSNFGQIPQIKA